MATETASDTYDEVDDLCVRTIRVVAAEAVQAANSGHPGAPIGLAPLAHVLFSRFIRANPDDTAWINRDRFVLSNGHACALLYTMLHLLQVKAPPNDTGRELTVSLDDLKQFRQIEDASKGVAGRTPGHPENHITAGIEVSTGPLGQGIAQGIGLALAQKHLAAVNNKDGFPVFDSKVYIICGDGCMQEGVASEAASLAAHWRLNNLILLYDDNTIQIDGHTDLAFTENVAARFEAYGWNTAVVEDGNEDLGAIHAAIANAQNSDRPTMISIKTVIGYKTTKANTHGVHGAPLGAESLTAFKTEMGLTGDAFTIDDAVKERYASTYGARGRAAQNEWATMFEAYASANPEDAARLKRQIAGELPDIEGALGAWDVNPAEAGKAKATRNTSGEMLNMLADVVPELIGGAADLTPSTKTALKNSHDFQDATPDGRYIRFGVREFAMFAICNGISAFGCLIPFSATFLNFITYGWGAVRLGALSHLRQIYIMTHDSIFLGEDGPTHQPVEVLPLLRSTPNLLCIRPADRKEVAGAYAVGLRHDGPTVICLSRQGVKLQENTNRRGVDQGAYVLADTGDEKDAIDVILVSSGSEVQYIVEAAASEGLADKKVRLVSAPCLDLFGEQDDAYKQSVLPKGVPVVAVEASGMLGWEKYSHFQFGMTTFGASGKLADVQKHFGFQPAQIAARTREILDRVAGQNVPPLSGIHGWN